MTALQNLVSAGADCTGGNSLTKLNNTLQQDPSLHRDRFHQHQGRHGGQHSGIGGSGSGISAIGPDFRQLQHRGELVPGAEYNESFFQTQNQPQGGMYQQQQQQQRMLHMQHGGSSSASMQSNGNSFDMGHMERALPHHHVPVTAGPMASGSWAADFQKQHQPQMNVSRQGNASWASDFQQQQQQQQQQQSVQHSQKQQEQVQVQGQHLDQLHTPTTYANSWASARMNQRMNYQMMRNSTMQNQQQQQQQQQQKVQSAEVSQEMQQAFADAQEAAQEQDKTKEWIQEFQTEAKNNLDVQPDTKNPSELAATAGRLLNVVDQSSANSKFKNSEFLEFIRKLRDEEVSIEGDKVIDNISPATIAKEFVKELNGDINSVKWEENFDATTSTASSTMLPNAEGRFNERMWAEAATQKLEPKQASFAESDALSWSDEFLAENNLYNGNNPLTMDPTDTFDSSYHAVGPQFSNYEYTANNPYMEKPIEFLTDVSQHRSLSESILSLEAAVQKDPHNALAWYYLGVRQQENERDVAAIAALKRATQENPNLLECWTALAVSFTNESYKADAYDALQSWIAHSPKYQHLLAKHNLSEGGPSNMTSQQKHQQTKKMYIDAIRGSSRSDEVDADLQIGLGVLFNISEEYEKAVDCFEVALGERPNDYMLWNKLGATLANSSESERAIDAYLKALEINPSYIRAKYNLAISCMLLRKYNEAAQHLLGALDIQSKLGHEDERLLSELNDTPLQGLQSDNVWEFLSQILFSFLDRTDLSDALARRDLDEFRKHFEF